MIPRTLVPSDARLPAADPAAAPRRRPSALDERTLIPPALPVVSLDGRTNIPVSLPLESISARVIVPRDLDWDALQKGDDSRAPVIPTDLDARVAVPTGSEPPETLQPIEHLPLDLVDPDILTTGEVHLMATAQQEAAARSSLITRISSVALHALVLLALLFQPEFLRRRAPKEESFEIARRQLSYVFLPPGLKNLPKPGPPNEPRSEKMRIDPRILRRIAPPGESALLPGPVTPERVVKDLPDRPSPQPNVAQAPPKAAPKSDLSRPPVKLETPDQQQAARGLLLPKISPGHAIEESIRESAKKAASAPVVSGGQLPGGGGAGRPGGGGASAYGALEMLTPTEGVDFTNYLARVYASVKQNWYAVMPQSVFLGDRGIVMLQFRILRNGGVPAGEPALVRTSGKEPLDRAAVSSIRASNPFEPLPSAFSGPYIELRFTYLYNVRIEDIQ